ncbi:ABC transporter permease [Clostridium algidicarnis]|uniref:Transport permease protein n=1 Tax=Clostridium algidicarnis TaxID=37659 RepID=A0ABS6C2S4_9CLOT|nr:ABC transporter permease [Clostridium algidicarnis]MBB6631835.1 ABC transporter permease [Clostridium algidicarnis]MBU3206994.1 ABC transporter permease [Clostridium algidicarnis]MBU3219789.1 ABC transporter permease [Clostridium algidicarnis]
MSIRENFNILRARFIISAKIYFRYPLNIILSLFSPIIWLSPFYFMAKAFQVEGKISGFESYTGNSDFIGFMVIGYMMASYMGVAMWSMGFSLKEEMRQGVLESNWSTPANKILLMVSQSMFKFCIATLEIIITGVICHFIFDFNITPDILKIIVILIPGIISLIGIGIAISAMVLITKEANTIIDISSGFLSAFSGSYFPLNVLPKSLMVISFAIPLTYLNDSMRGILLGQKTFLPFKYELIIIIMFTFLSAFLGVFIFNKTERKCRELGVVSGH